MQKGYLNKETEIVIIAAQDQALCTRNLGNAVYEENVQSICRVCAAADETVVHVVSEFSKLAQKEYNQVRRDDNAKMLHWKLFENWGFNKAEKWYMHKPEKVLECESCKILWDFSIQTDKILEHN